ncbi:NAD-dependent succinate-semialdehyde dehydrogenase [Sphingomonas metalli]|uniref:NAD-dependent succinate-semialdehyde dehydrogenase n=1 Tax=Sphingomonas metalli TaxID=1779358 RepID=A0A916TFC9_9SPHN|nr:NAD-dependent succinate-semialdehyde dehydrogenase [Sphingomonas metalli]GGB42898.1 NAD-dependent succinate-semialdehyde dehydrogenase [Sphingomonas metalli]
MDTARFALSRADLRIEAAYIAGGWETGGGHIAVHDPATGLLVGHVPNLGAVAATRAVDAAATALGDWRARSGKERSAVLRRWFDALRDHRDDLASIITGEQGKPLAEARAEVDYGAAFVEWFAEEAKRVQGFVTGGPTADSRITVLRQPVGVVAAVTPWNFPLAMITRKAAPALAVGCTMVLKPSELTPFTALALARLGEEAGIPGGVFNVVTGAPGPIGDVLTGDPRVRKFTFTGSTAIGKMLATRCAATVKRVSLELGGNAPLLVFDDADLEAAVEGALASKFRNAGQTCVCANRVLVQNGIYDAFASQLAERVATMTMGDGFVRDYQIGPLIDDRAVQKARRHVEDALEKGASLLVGGPSAPSHRGSFFRPTVLRDVSPDALLAREETFGPVAGLIRFETDAEAIALANDTPAGLAAYVFTRSADRMTRIAEALEYGMIGLNTGLISSELAPFGGIKESGYGREGGQLGIDDYLVYKTVTRVRTR